MAGGPCGDEVAAVVRREWSRVLATLVGDLGDLADAEDALADAVEEAVRRWPIRGLPERPGAWLTTVARRRAIDRLRRSSAGRDKAELAGRMQARLAEVEDPMDAVDPDASLLRDEQLRLLFACCHPALTVEAQVALTLRCVAGLSTVEISRAFVQPEATVAQRLVRAKRKIAAAAIPFRIPPDSVLLERCDQVRTIIYLVFNEGYEASAGGELVRTDLCAEAIRLAELVAELLADDAESHGLVALLRLIHSRREARVDAVGDLVLLGDQDRSRWDGALITAGQAALERALRLDAPGPYQIQAAIQALHAEAPSSEATDWRQIELLYRRLRRHLDTPVVELNHAVAVALAGDRDAGLAMLDSPRLAERLGGYTFFHSARARLLHEVDPAGAGAAYRAAIAVTSSEPELRFLRRQLARAERGEEPGGPPVG
ncbi:MAG: sigma-70 family RNA polymerase sigma factor [Acidimicrobiia bacterium]|nr:sigma-70 family RNA polymerase sigma factor [Acidimicrobiia bacterium]